MAQTKRDLEQLVAATKQSATKAKDTQTAYNSFLTNVIRNYGGNIPYSVDARTTDFQNAASTGSLNASTLNSLLGNEPGDWRPKRGDKADKNILRDALFTKNAFVDYARQNGVFDTEQYAFDPASVVMPSTPYLQQLYTQMSDPAYQSAANAEHKKKSNITLLQDEWGRIYNGMRDGEHGYPQLSNIANPDDNLLALTEWLISGGDTETDISGMSAEDLAAWRDAALRQYNDYGLSNEQTWSDLANGDYSVGDQPAYIRNLGIVSQELARRQRVSDLTAAAQALPDFETRSVYHSPYESSAFNPVDGFGGFGDVASYVFGQHHTDDLQWLINNPPAYLGEFAGAYEDFFEKGYNLLDDEDKKIYNVLMDEDPEMAAAFLEAIGPDLLSGRRQIDKWYNSALASGPVTGPISFAAAAIGNVGESFRSGFTAAGLAVGSVPEDPNDSYYDNLNSISDIRTEQRDIFGDALNFEIAGHRVGELAYDALTGITDFGTAIGAATILGNPMYAQYIMGGEAMASTTHEMLKRGWDGKAAAVTGMFAGAIETFFEHFSLDKLFKMSPADGLGLFIATNGLVEASEEFNTDIFNPLAEAFVGYLFDEETNAQERYYDLVNNQKLTDKAASNVIFGEFLNSAAYSSAVGLIVGSASAGGRAGIETYANTRTGKPIAASETGEADLLSLAETMAEDSETKKILPTLKKTKGGKNVKASELGRLARTMAAELDGESHSVLASATASVVRQHLNATGRAQDIHTAAQEVGTTPKVLAETIAKGINGTRMNAEERRIFGKSDFAKSMVRELGLDLKVPTMIKQARLHSITNPTAQVEEQRENAAVVRATQLINPASNDPHSDHLVYEVDGQQAEGDILRFDEVDGELLVVVKDGDGNRAALSRDMITSMDGSTQATVVELVTSGGERISAPKANLMLRAAQYEKPESMASFLTAFDSVYDAGWYGRSMEAVEGLSSDLAADVYALGQNEAKAAEEARVTRDGAFKRVKGGLVTYLGNVKTREELVGEGTVDALTAIEGSLTETQRANVEGIKAIAKALDAQIVLYSSDADSISDLPNGQYMPDTGLIYLDINAGAETAEGVEAARAAGTLGNAMVTSLSHELTHAIERGSKQGYIDFKQAMIDQFKKRGGPTFEQLVQQKIGEQYANFGIRLTRQAAEAEVVAYGAELMLQNSDVIATLKPSLAEKIRTFIADFLKKVRNAFSIMPSLSTESSALVEMRDGVLKYADDLQKKWNIALQEAVGMEGEAVATAAQEQAAEAAPAAEETQTETAAPVQPTTSEEAPLVTAEEQALQSEEAPPSFDLIAALDGQDQPAGQSEALNKGTEAQATDGSGALYSMRAMKADAELYRGMLRAAGVEETEITTLFNTIDVAMEFIAQHPELDFTDDADPASRSFSPVKPNSDSLYQVSIDFSTLCRKRLLQQAIQERLEAKYKTTISKAQRIAIRNALIQLQHEKKQIEVACALCYVESARLKSPEQVAKFLADRRTYIVDYMAKKNKDYIAEINARADELIRTLSKGKETTIKGLSTAQKKVVRDMKRDMYAAYQPTAEEAELIAKATNPDVVPDTMFTTSEGLRKLKREMPEIFDAYTTRIRNATKSKGIEADVSWRAGDSESISDSLIKTMNSENGLRSQSWSDFQVIHLLDYIAATIELSTRNAKMQTYTKVSDFVRLMGHTGWMINMSLIPRNFNGETLEFDPVEGMDYDEAMELRDQFPDTAGVVAIGISDPHARALMEDDNIDYIIMYHRSSLDKKSRAQMGLGLWDDYEGSQNEKQKDYDGVTNPDGEMYHKKPKFSEWFDYATVSARAKEVGAKKAMQEAAQRYIQLCHERGLQEKFPQFADHPGYWKHLVDRKMINQKTGEIIEQRAVQPIFDQGTIIDIMQRESDRFEEFTRQADEAASVIEQMWKAGEIQKAANAKNVRDMVKSFEDSVIINTIVESAEDLPSSTGAQYSMRGRGDSITVREYVAEADESLATSNAERNALELYKKRLANYTDITRQLRDARAAVRQAESDEARAQAQANVNTLLGKRASAYDKLVSAESTPHISQIMARTRTFLQDNLVGKTREDLEALISRTESEIAELTEMVAGLEKASRTQSRERKTIVAQLEEAKQSIEDKKRTIAQLRSRATERYLALRQHYEDRIERDRTRRQIMEESRKKERHVKKVVRRLHDKLVNESDTRNIKEHLKPVAIKLVNAFLEGFGRSVFSSQSTAKLYPLYQELAREAGVDTTEFASDINELFEILNETAVRYGEYASHGGNSIEQATLRLQIFDTLADIVDHVDALVRNADATFADGKRTTISLLSDSVYESLADRKNKRTLRGVAGKATQLFSDTTWMGNLLPTYFFEQLGNETLNDLFVDIRRGMSDSMRIVRDAQDFMQDLKKRKHYYSWRLGDTIDIHTAQGHDLHLPVEVAIALYVTAKRERTNTIAATRHLQDGGFRMDEDAAKKGLFNPEETSGFHRMSDEDITRLESLLTEDQKSYGDEIATYLAEHMGALGNQVSMATYGIRKYKEGYYIPFVTASIQRAQSSSKGSTATTDDSRLAHQSFSHRLRTGANTALQIGNITDMALRHVYSMANYVGMATPIENLNRVLNHNIEAEDGSKSTIRAIFEQKYGKIALKYLEDLMRDVNGTTQSDNRSMGGINFAISAFKRGAVAGKLAVSLQQPTAIFRAAAYLGIRDFVGIPVARVPSAWQELLKYSGTAIAKDMGRYDIGLGQTAVEYMAQDDMTGYNIFQRVQNRTIKENWKSFTDLTTALPGFMDQLAWVNIFAMVKREQARLHPGMDTSSEEFLKLCGERFDDVVYHTQVFDSVLSRSSLMRSKNAVHMAATSFMAEPTMTLNMIRSAIFAKHTKAERAKIVVSCLVATIGASAAGALVGGFNKDDDDRTWWEKYLSNFTSRAIDGLNPMSLFPYFNALSDLLEGYETERLDTAVFGDIVTHVKQAYNGNLTPWKTVELLGGDIANLFGLPLGGVMGDVRRIRNAINSSKAAVPADELKFSVLEAAPYGWYKGGTTAYYERMAAAAINGDKAEVQAIRNYMLRAYQTDGEKIDSGMKSAMKDRFVAGDVPEGDAINVLVSYGLAKDKNDAYWTVDRWEHKAETGSDDGYSKYNDFTEAVRTGKNLKSVTNTYLNNGVTKSTLAGRITDAFDEEYVQLYKTDKRAAAALKARLLTAYELLGYDRTRKSKDIDKWIKD